MDKKIIGIIFLVISLFLSVGTFAETVVLKSGKTIEGKIIEETDIYIKLQTIEGKSLYFYKNTIDAVKGDNEASVASLIEPGHKTGLSDYSFKGYMTFVPSQVSSTSPILICLPGSSIKTKQDINNWAFTAGKKGFIVLGIMAVFFLLPTWSRCTQRCRTL